MSSIDIVALQEQLVASEAELEQAKATIYRLDGIIALLKHLIKKAETPADAVVEGVIEPAEN